VDAAPAAVVVDADAIPLYGLLSCLLSATTEATDADVAAASLAAVLLPGADAKASFGSYSFCAAAAVTASANI